MRTFGYPLPSLKRGWLFDPLRRNELITGHCDAVRLPVHLLLRERRVIVLFGIPVRENGSGDIVPSAEDRARNRS